MTGDAFREIVLNLEGTTEGAHMKHPDFRAGGRIFASLTSAETSAIVKLSLEEQQELIGTDAKVFAPASGAWGRQGWTTVALERATPSLVRAAVTLAWEAAVAKPTRPTPPRASRSAAPKAAVGTSRKRTGQRSSGS